MDLSTRNLEQALSIRRKIDVLQRRFNNLVGGGGGGAVTSPRHRAGRHKMSAAARAKIAAAQRARWAKTKAGQDGAVKPRGKKGGITATGRKRLSQLMKARWAARRKAAKGKK